MDPIRSPLAPPPIGPYSQAVKAGGWLFCSGQVALGPTGQELLPRDIEEQAQQVLKNLQAVLLEAGTTTASVVKTTIYLRDMNDFAAVNAIYSTYFAEPFPARETVAVAGLPRGAKVEISCVAYLGS
jgi:2-iminobutanoate/2-iminopropanoate deaminase